MNQLKQIIETYNIEILLALMGAFILLLLLYIIAEIRIWKIKKRYEAFTRGIKGLNIEELLVATGEDINSIKVDINKIEKEIETLDTKLAFAIQKVGFVRYNAFGDMGSEMSFSIALMDKFQNGFVITSLYGREFTTSYAKSIKLGKSEYPLSVEEMQAVDRAIMGEYKEKRL